MATFVDSVGLAPASTPQQSGVSFGPGGTPFFTCLSCAIAFPNPDDQRAHYRTDLHRYNMKRRVASLPPVKADAFNAKILERRQQLAKHQSGGAAEGNEIEEEEAGGRCSPCGKTFSSRNAYKDHMGSRKHRETVAKVEALKGCKAAQGPLPAASKDDGAPTEEVPLKFRVPYAEAAPSDSAASGLAETGSLKEALPSVSFSSAQLPSHSKSKRSNLPTTLPDDATEEQMQAAIDAKVASASRINPNTTCFFCISPTQRFSSLEDTLAHMRKAHSFFIPERTYLTDLAGLMEYLADKVAVGNICLYCNGHGRGFASKEAVQGHMIDKAHCKIAYEEEEDKLELGDFYDFSSSYPDVDTREERRERRRLRKEAMKRVTAATDWEVINDEDENGDAAVQEDGEWEDEDVESGDDDDVDKNTEGDDSDTDSDLSEAPQARYGDNEYELVLPSGTRLGHRAMRRYYNQSLRTTPASSERYAPGGNSGGALARRLIGDGRSAEDRSGTLVKDRGGQVVRARNRGEAMEAQRYYKEFRDIQRKEQFKTKIGYRNNNQKHFRDPLLQ
ncbi:hypothetical protein K437DRAFT_248403 [Tilletiaria anomala UBC 951]|uniref:C2H2-type domain-containing protein n=1 Tax=Tilletiaria anomala (strain ATCC 24038 / CBS 436.72 / UBC 951) TaxID=1037660 RepID=A0A066VPZ3_TILAU|nr:uncharacterized protein K437DRAFT_248403 [Tilletiaria anomala UBC 951]KDN43556.1 hypothetical protein K437DRAFT_248403 [Tilletiaria anomala UBC 951]